ncbi:MAG TPA: KpsF/GutQ family sugar-phosphate isomerase [Acidisarcina sp.]
MKEHTPARLVRIEVEALLTLAERLDGPMSSYFERAVVWVMECSASRGRVLVTGMGKSGIIAQKIAATLNSTGTPAFFLHAADALHGDLGMLSPGDVLIVLSASGETEELVRLVAALKREGMGQGCAAEDRGEAGNRMISFCCDINSTLGRASDLALDCSVAEEACSMGLAPTASTTVMLALGDALAIAVSQRKGFREEDFADLHPGGKLGKRLARVRQLMHSGDAVPQVALATPMSEVIYEMSRKGLGITTVQEAGRLVGIISDGDLRRLLEREGPDALHKSAGEAMHAAPLTIAPDQFAATALHIMEERKITSLVVMDETGAVLGVLHLHDLWRSN